MFVSMMPRQVVLFKTTRLLNTTKKYLGKPRHIYEFPIGRFFQLFGLGVMEMRKQYGRDYDVTPYLMSTPHIRQLSQSMANTFIHQREHLQDYVDFTETELAFSPYAFSATGLCCVRSGMEFFFTSFADVPVTTGKSSVPFKHFYNDVAGDLVESFDVSLKFYAHNFRFQFDDRIPPKIPSSHWWWMKKIQNTTTDIRDLYY